MSRSDKPARQRGRQAQAGRMAAFALGVTQLAVAHANANGLTDLEAAAVYAEQTHALIQAQAERRARDGR